MSVAYELVKLVRSVAEEADTVMEQAIADGVAETAENQYASVRLGANDSATPGFYFPPGLDVQAGDHVLVFRLKGYQLVLAVLQRNAVVAEAEFVTPLTRAWQMLRGGDNGELVAIDPPYLTTAELPLTEHQKWRINKDTGEGEWVDDVDSGGSSGPTIQTVRLSGVVIGSTTAIDVPVTWPAAWADSSYYVFAQAVIDNAGVGRLNIGTRTKTTAQTVLRLRNDGGTALTIGIDVLGLG